jgi:hypothetical protein
MQRRFRYGRSFDYNWNIKTNKSVGYKMHKTQWKTPECLHVPDSSAYYTLVSLTFHHSQYGASGHFTSWLRHIGGSTVLGYDDMSPIIHPLPERSQQQFGYGSYRARKGLSCAVYYLVGGEATQNALYQEQLAYIKHHFGVDISHSTTPGNPENSRWPSKASLSTKVQGSFALQPIQPTQSHFALSPIHCFRLEFQQGYRPPKPSMRRILPDGQLQHIPAHTPPWQYTPTDPTESHLLWIFGGGDAVPRRIVSSEVLVLQPGTLDLLSSSPLLSDQTLVWNLKPMLGLDLWHVHTEDIGEDMEEEKQQIHLAKRARGLRSPSPTISGHIGRAELTTVIHGMNTFSELIMKTTLLTPLLVWLEGTSTISPVEKKRRIVASKNMIPFQAQETQFKLNDQAHTFTKAGCW